MYIVYQHYFFIIILCSMNAFINLTRSLMKWCHILDNIPIALIAGRHCMLLSQNKFVQAMASCHWLHLQNMKQPDETPYYLEQNVHITMQYTIGIIHKTDLVTPAKEYNSNGRYFCTYDNFNITMKLKRFNEALLLLY